MVIKSVTVVTAVGVNAHTVGHTCEGKKIAEIKISEIRTNGDAYEHYCGYDSDGALIFSVDKLCPCEVIYC